MKTEAKSRARARVWWLAAAILPTLAVQGVRMLGGPVLPSAHAARPAAVLTPELPRASTLALREDQKAASEWLRSLELDELQDPFRSTLAVPSEAPAASADPLETQVQPPPASEAVEEKDAKALAQLELRGVVGSGPSALASIGDRLHRIGSEVLPSWTLESVDARRRSATLRHAEGRTWTLRVK
ncbi:MAG: hypothetical protein SFZ23_06355 [Planctomycetota bacterium]|nr:hypothetical protein [Planctomycetota bacterium]